MPAWIETEDTSNISFTVEISAEGKNNWIGLQSRNYDFIFQEKISLMYSIYWQKNY